MPYDQMCWAERPRIACNVVIEDWIIFFCCIHRSGDYKCVSVGRAIFKVAPSGSWPHLVHGSLCPPELVSQTASRSIQPLSTAHPCDQHTARQTDRQTYDICSNMLCLCNAMQCGLVTVMMTTTCMNKYSVGLFVCVYLLIYLLT